MTDKPVPPKPEAKPEAEHKANNIPASANAPYHHGNLQLALLNASVDIIRAHGVAGLSLRKLAEVVGVSRTAPYHHFKDKEALLAAVAAQGFEELSGLLAKVIDQPDLPLMEQLNKAVLGYLKFALTHPTQYELMFGQTLWQAKQYAEFQRTAKDCFRQYVHLFEEFQRQGLIANTHNPLRLAQMTWASLHGLAKLASDGIFAKESDVHEIALTALQQLEPLLRPAP